MKILHIIYDDIGNPWLGGGGAMRTLEIYSRIVQHGHKVLVVCGQYPDASRRQWRQGVLYRRVGRGGSNSASAALLPIGPWLYTVRTRGRQSYLLSRLTFMAGAARLIRRGGYDIVIEDVSPFSPVASPMWKPSGVPAVASVQNLSGIHAPDKYGMAGHGPRMVEKPLLSLFTNFVAVSSGIDSQLREIIGHGIDVRVIPNGVDPIFFEERDAKSLDGLSGEYVLSLGRIDVYQKGLDRLIRAFDLFASRVTEVNLVVAGAGTSAQDKALKSLVEGAHHRKRIHVLGNVPPADAARLMRGALALVMPSRYEAWPLTALEAGAAGVPIVGSDIVGIRDASPPFPGGNGILSPEGDTVALVESLVTLTSDLEYRARVGARGREWAERFTWDSLAEQQLAYYEELVNRSRISNQ